jgi:RNA polymerase sigma factor (sigma-70 family)
MRKKSESDFAEINVDGLIEQLPNEASAYFKSARDEKVDELFDRFRTRLRYHLARSLSPRQKEVMRLLLLGKKQREIAAILGIQRPVVSIYKRRAINKLRKIMTE